MTGTPVHAEPGHYQAFWKEADRAARRRGVTLEYAEVRAESDVPKAFSAMVSRRAGATVIFGGPNLWAYRSRIADLAARIGFRPYTCIERA